ncbi:MAG: type II/IV secretion system protein [Variovorax sp.]|nr:MAG: type II/IV secretion system protein [Variovorax sp.]
MLESGLLDAVQLEYARQKHAVRGEALWRIVIGEGLAGEREVVALLGGVLGIEFIDAESIEYPEQEVLALFNKEQCLTSNFLPLGFEGRDLTVLLGDAMPDDVAQLVMRRLGLRCRFRLASFSQVARLIRNAYYFAKNPPEKLLAQEVTLLTSDRDHAFTPEHLLSHLLHLAMRERATDIHITSGVASLHVLFRIDGVLQPIRALPPTLGRLIGFIKIAAEMDISEARRPQDGSFRAVVLDDPLTVRVSTIVTEHGERMVMRLLPEAHDVKDLAALGFFPEDVETVAAAMANPAGLILITGPTGSGKSSTLHAGLRMQHLIERNVLTVEDPLEYRVPMAGQTEVNRRAGYDFGTALRHFLRHDPDVILVGEMRDAETAQAAVDAAATGHLVLSTLHVTSVFGVVPRLTPFGLVPQVIAENLKLVINQRLVRRLCAHCAEPVAFTPAECEWLEVEAGTIGRRSRGCPRCRHTGFNGRLPLYELLTIDDDLANAIADAAGREAIRTLAAAKGFETIAKVAKRRVKLGQTTGDEVLRVIGEGPSR